MKKLALFLFGLGSLLAVSVNAAGINNSQEPVPTTQEPCNPAPCDTVCNPVPCNPAPCNPGC